MAFLPRKGDLSSAPGRSEFFQKPGLRLVTFLPRWLYDVAVPLSIYPAPSRVVRVALVLREIQ
jgi:hypothetical protein